MVGDATGGKKTSFNLKSFYTEGALKRAPFLFVGINTQTNNVMRVRVLLILVASLFLISLTIKKRTDVIVKNDMFTIHYSEVLEQPTSVEYDVQCTETKFSRKGLDFYTCDSVYTSDNEDYANNEYDKGHMAPAADFSCDEKKLKGTFTYLNCALQQENLNRGVWRMLEVREREIALRYKTSVKILIHFSSSSRKLPSGATIPDAFTKIITYDGYSEKYYFPNVKPSKLKFDDYRIK